MGIDALTHVIEAYVSVKAQPMSDIFCLSAIELIAELKARGLRSVVQTVEPDHLERTEFKGKRVIDKRSLYDEITQQK